MKKEKRLVKLQKLRPYQFPVPVEMFFMDDVLPDRTQGKSWMGNALINLIKVIIRVRDNIDDNYL